MPYLSVSYWIGEFCVELPFAFSFARRLCKSIYERCDKFSIPKYLIFYDMYTLDSLYNVSSSYRSCYQEYFLQKIC